MGGVGNATQGTSKLADRSYYRIDLGKAQARFLSARSFYYETTESAWETLARGELSFTAPSGAHDIVVRAPGGASERIRIIGENALEPTR